MSPLSPSGNITSQSNPSQGDRFGFTGREFDALTGLQYNRARYYDPQAGSWISQDPTGFDGGDTNLYRYAGNGPTDGTDPTGTTLVVARGGENQWVKALEDVGIKSRIGILDGGYWYVKPDDASRERLLELQRNTPASDKWATKLYAALNSGTQNTVLGGSDSNYSLKSFQLSTTQVDQAMRWKAMWADGANFSDNARDQDTDYLTAGVKTFLDTLIIKEIYGGGKALLNGTAMEALGNRAVQLVENQTGQPFTGSFNDYYIWATHGIAGDLTGVNSLVEGTYGYDLATYQGAPKGGPQRGHSYFLTQTGKFGKSSALGCFLPIPLKHRQEIGMSPLGSPLWALDANLLSSLFTAAL